MRIYVKCIIIAGLRIHIKKFGNLRLMVVLQVSICNMSTRQTVENLFVFDRVEQRIPSRMDLGLVQATPDLGHTRMATVTFKVELFNHSQNRFT